MRFKFWMERILLKEIHCYNNFLLQFRNIFNSFFKCFFKRRRSVENHYSSLISLRKSLTDPLPVLLDRYSSLLSLMESASSFLFASITLLCMISEIINWSSSGSLEIDSRKVLIGDSEGSIPF